MTLHRTLRGEGRPVVLLHAGGLDSRMFEHDMPKLEKVAAVLRYDRSGSGRSPAATGPIDRVEELRTVSNEAFDGRPCALVGSSYGGQLAIDFALAHPTLVAGLMLIGPGLTGHQDSDQRRMRMEALAAAARRGGSALAALWLNDPHLCPHGFPTPIEQQVRDMLQDNAGLFVSPQPSVGAGPAVGRLGGLARAARSLSASTTTATTLRSHTHSARRWRALRSTSSPAPGTFQCWSARDGCRRS